jgi:hypothetical protein
MQQFYLTQIIIERGKKENPWNILSRALGGGGAALGGPVAARGGARWELVLEGGRAEGCTGSSCADARRPAGCCVRPYQCATLPLLLGMNNGSLVGSTPGIGAMEGVPEGKPAGRNCGPAELEAKPPEGDSGSVEPEGQPAETEGKPPELEGTHGAVVDSIVAARGRD